MTTSKPNRGNKLGDGISGQSSTLPTVQCEIRTLHPELDFDNLTRSLSQNSLHRNNFELASEFFSVITRLTLVCNDVLFFESSLQPGQLSTLSELHELTIVKCKLKQLPAQSFQGLRHLRKLTINTGNSEWAARSLELHSQSLSSLPHLKSLNLGFNHMWSLPSPILCEATALQTLNLTHNLLSDIDDLGLPGQLRKSSQISTDPSDYPVPKNDMLPNDSECLGELKVFDLSHNSLRTLGSARFAGMKRLQQLHLNHNWLEEMDDAALVGLNQLRLLNLSSNRLVALPHNLLTPCKNLRELDLRNNSLTALSPGLLDGLDRLQILDLSVNSISSQWITAAAFKYLVRLVILNLSKNELTHLASSTFSDLYSLQVLDLSENLISSIGGTTFSPLSNLHSLNLARNRLKQVGQNTLNGLYVLHKLSLDYNHISELHAQAFTNCTSLQDLSLVGNNLTGTVPSALHHLSMLRTLDLGENKIDTLTNTSFTGMSQLYGLRLVDNLLTQVPKGLCEPVSRLRVLNVAQNQIKDVSSSAFSACSSLRVLRLDSNVLETLPTGLAPQLGNLLWLNVSENKIRWVDYSLLPSSLEWLDVSRNDMESLGGAWSVPNGVPRSGQHHNSRLRVVNVSHNKLTTLDIHMVPPFLEVLSLSYNHLTRIAPETFSRSSQLRRVELIGNQIESIPLNSIHLPLYPEDRALPEFFLGGNPFLCDCGMDWLTRMGQLSSIRRYPIVLDLDSIVCRLTFSRSVSRVPLPEMKTSDFLCPYESHCFALCHCCEFDACDCKMTCPQNCTCYHDETWSSNVVNCASSGHNIIPPRLPMDSTQVYLDGNNIGHGLKSHIFIGRKNVKVLFLNNSHIESISNKTFNGLHSLTGLYLHGNNLQILNGYEFDKLSHLKELYLNDNMLTAIVNTTFVTLKSLEILRLDGNKLVVFTVWQLSLNPYLVEIGLARNEWNCECDFLHQLYGWVTDNSRKLIDLNEMQCVWNRTKKAGPHLIDYNRTCVSTGAIWGIPASIIDQEAFVPILASSLVFIGVIVVLIIFFSVCRQNAKLWLFHKLGLRLCSSESKDSSKSYDAYFIYSEKDEEWITHAVSDDLEANDNYRLCLHYRDLLSEAGDVREMMFNGMDNSKTFVLFLSRNFLQSEWTSCDFRSALQSLVKKLVSSGHKLNIVLIEDIPWTEVHCDILRSWLSSHKKVNRLQWSPEDNESKKKFWYKLKFALPEPESHYHSNITNTTSTRSSDSSSEAHPSKKLIPQNHTISMHQPSPWPDVYGGQHYSPRQTQVILPPSGTMSSPHRVPQQFYAGENSGSSAATTASIVDEHPNPGAIGSPYFSNRGTSASKKRGHLLQESSSYLSLEGEHVYSTLDPPSPHNNMVVSSGYPFHNQYGQQWSRTNGDCGNVNSSNSQNNVVFKFAGNNSCGRPTGPKKEVTLNNSANNNVSGSTTAVQTYLV